MKRKIVALLAVVSIMSVGCSNNNNTKNQEPVDYITEQKVNEIVLADTPNGNIVEFTFDKDDVKPNYDVTVVDGQTTYEYEIDAVTGDILHKEVKTETTENNNVSNNTTSNGNNSTSNNTNKNANNKVNNNANNNTNNSGFIGKDKAKAIALEIIPNGTVVEVELDTDDSTPNYDVKVTDGTYEYEYEINAKDGSIITQSKEKVND